MKIQLDPEVIDALEAGQKIQAIKILRSSTGMSLKEAKDAVDNYIVEYGLTDLYKKGSGIEWGTIALLLAIGYLVYLFVKN